MISFVYYCNSSRSQHVSAEVTVCMYILNLSTVNSVRSQMAVTCCKLAGAALNRVMDLGGVIDILILHLHLTLSIAPSAVTLPIMVELFS